ncbi:carbohydrate-binding module family 1 protein [Peniophora sp. CONT]|nr:carbohydrate-binding module family 1 protein [Peniophora sp. CONT]
MFIQTTLLAALVSRVAAHATFQDLWVNNVDQGQFCVRLPASNNPITDVTSNDLACNANASPSSGLCQVMPGDTVTVEMHQQPKDRSCANEAIGGDHFGPVQVYMAKVDDATTAVGSSQSWFKIGEMGLPSNNPDYWATEVLNDNCGHFTVTVPKDIAPGNYLLRAEVIALHVASSPGGAQFYASCFQVNVGGSGTAKPSGVKIPGAYGASDPGILINIYQTLATYNIPGPTPYNSASPVPVATPWPKTATWNTATQPTTVPALPAGSSSAAPAPPATTAAGGAPPSQTSAASGATQTAYGQCGGTGWTGATACASGFKCNAQSQYYAQCVPA